MAPHTLQALLRSWLTAQQGLLSGNAAGDAADSQAAEGAAADGDLLFYVSTEGDAAAAGAAASDEEDQDSDGKGGLDLAQLPGSDGNDGDSESNDDASAESED